MSNPIRVLHVIGSMNRGGAEAMIMNFYRAIDRTRVQFDFVQSAAEKAQFDSEITSLGGRIFHSPHYNGKNYFAYKKWWNRFLAEHEGEFSVIHGHIGSSAPIYLAAAKKHGIFTIAHSHSSGTDHSLGSKLYAIASFRTRYIADYFFGCSLPAGLDRYGKAVVQGDRFSILHNSVDAERFRFNPGIRRKMREAFSVGDDTLVIGHAGRFLPVKNHAFLLKIFAEIVAIHPDSVLLLVGEGPLRKQIMEQARQMGLYEKCIFTGLRSDVNELMQMMDVLAFPSVFEGLPVTLVEAQMAGLPIVISDSVPSESILIDELGRSMPLKASPQEWAACILEMTKVRRIDRTKEMSKAGYEVNATAKWLEEFYIGKSKR